MSTHLGSGTHNVNTSQGRQFNNSIAEGSNHQQFNANNISIYNAQSIAQGNPLLEVTAWRSLRPTLDARTQKGRNRNKHPETFQWFLESCEYTEWRDASDFQILWISARPGCGKSTLLASLIDSELASSDARTTAYFFFGEEESTRSATNAIASLLHQVLRSRLELRKYAAAEFENYDLAATGEYLSNIPQAMREIFKSILLGGHSEEIVLALDALDQCSKSTLSDLSGLLADLRRHSAEQAHTPMKFIITCRVTNDNLEGFADVAPVSIDFHDSHELQDDIWRVIQSDCQQLARVLKLQADFWTTRVREESLLQTLWKVERRTYLWWKLISEEIRLIIPRNRTRANVLKLIQSLPVELRHTYHRLLMSVSVENRPRSLKLFELVVGAVRPLTVHEIMIALDAENDGKDLSMTTEQDVLSVENMLSDIYLISGLLLTVDGSRYVHFIHPTARDFLLDWTYNETHARVDLCEAHHTLSRACLFHLDRHVLPLQSVNHGPGIAADRPFDEYATTEWMGHMENAGDKTQDSTFELAMQMCDTKSKGFMFQSRQDPMWVHGVPRTSDGYDRYLRCLLGAVFLRLKCMVGYLHRKLGEIRLNTQFDHGRVETSQRNLLFWAVKHASTEVCEYLLHNGQDQQQAIDASVMTSAVKNEACGDGMLDLLLPHWGDRSVPEDVVLAAAQNEWRGNSLVQILIKSKPHTELSEDVLHTIAINHKAGPDLMKWLFENSAITTVSDRVLRGAASNPVCGDKVLKVMIECTGINLETCDILESAVSNEWRAAEVVRILCGHRMTPVISARVISNLAKIRGGKREETIDLILAHKPVLLLSRGVTARMWTHDITSILLRILRCSPRVWTHDDALGIVQAANLEVIETMFTHGLLTYGSDVLEAAMRNLYHGLELFHLLLRIQSDLVITKGAVVAALSNQEIGDLLMQALYQHEPSLVIPENAIDLVFQRHQLYPGSSTPLVGQRLIDILVVRSELSLTEQNLQTAIGRMTERLRGKHESRGDHVYTKCPQFSAEVQLIFKYAPNIPISDPVAMSLFHHGGLTEVKRAVQSRPDLVCPPELCIHLLGCGSSAVRRFAVARMPGIIIDKEILVSIRESSQYWRSSNSDSLKALFDLMPRLELAREAVLSILQYEDPQVLEKMVTNNPGLTFDKEMISATFSNTLWNSDLKAFFEYLRRMELTKEAVARLHAMLRNARRTLTFPRLDDTPSGGDPKPSIAEFEDVHPNSLKEGLYTLS